MPIVDSDATSPSLCRQRVPTLPWWAVSLLLFATARLVTTGFFLAVQHAATPQSRAGSMPSWLELISTWDGQWYWIIAVHGYPAHLPLTSAGLVDTNPWAFLPLYPYLVKALTFGVADWRLVGFTVSLIAGFGAAVTLTALLKPHIGQDRALFATAVFACSPLSFMLQTTYAEALSILLLLTALLFIDRHRYLAAIVPSLLLAFTRPGALALALAVCLQLAVRLVQHRRLRAAPVPRRQLFQGLLLAVISAAAGLVWPLVAAAVTGRTDAYFATEQAWRRLWMPSEDHITLLKPWLFAANYWATMLFGGRSAAWIAPTFLILLVAAFGALLFSPAVRQLGLTCRAWAAAWALYLLAVFFPQSSIFRLLMPLSPLAGALTPSRTVPRVAVLTCCLALQALWLWVTYGPIQAYWTIP